MILKHSVSDSLGILQITNISTQIVDSVMVAVKPVEGGKQILIIDQQASRSLGPLEKWVAPTCSPDGDADRFQVEVSGMINGGEVRKLIEVRPESRG